ncbi:hypothetical protein SAMN05443432_11238 [Roseovarius litoreus]|uniref:Uncharacterized protein n=1 Tax=Roseovarius litoreus TaxID=1155722 RepID=A0A1M7KW41_9RHOB|nr:hypothetical protein [Roseovarius litoreus]SHM69468.1 hypothetical protein SAMN05443432_11238 [Roseovarius litoreus]
MNSPIRQHDLLITLIVSTLFVLLALFSLKVIVPLQDAHIYNFESSVLLLYLPHGIRVLTAWLYGWKSILHILPGQVVTHIIFLGPASLLGVGFFDVIGGASIGYIGVLAALYLLQGHKTGLLARPWVLILLAGVIASLANSAIKIMVHDALPKEVFGYLLGDITGLVLLMIILLYIFKVERQTKPN